MQLGLSDQHAESHGAFALSDEMREMKQTLSSQRMYEVTQQFRLYELVSARMLAVTDLTVPYEDAAPGD